MVIRTLAVGDWDGSGGKRRMFGTLENRNAGRGKDVRGEPVGGRTAQPLPITRKQIPQTRERDIGSVQPPNRGDAGKSWYQRFGDRIARWLTIDDPMPVEQSPRVKKAAAVATGVEMLVERATGEPPVIPVFDDIFVKTRGRSDAPRRHT